MSKFQLGHKEIFFSHLGKNILFYVASLFYLRADFKVFLNYCLGFEGHV
jgi:hypothetical protein